MTTILPLLPDPPAATASHLGPGRDRSGSPVVMGNVDYSAGDGTQIISDVTVTVAPGQLVAIVGASGAGKSTLLDLMGGNLRPSGGRVLIGSANAHDMATEERRRVGFVHQLDILPEDLPLGRMLRYAALLRLPGWSTRRAVDDAVERALAQVELSPVRDSPVRSLSGGQRRRASIAVELLTNPDVCLLDEPTSGLDPSAADSLLGELRSLADAGSTVIFTSHNASDLRTCDRVVSLTPDGMLGFSGSPAEAIELAGTNRVEDVHRTLVARTSPAIPIGDVTPTQPTAAGVTEWSMLCPDEAEARAATSPVRQWLALTTRSFETMARNRLTLAIMLGSPAMVVAMFAILFQPGAFGPMSPSPTSAIMIAFWVAFGGFFFGLTYGLLQISPEVPVMKREFRAGIPAGLQLLAKVTALTPVLLAIDVAMLGVLRGLDRLPALDASSYARLAITLGLDAIAALALGLLASSAVKTPAQASLALPMLCFPAVLFSGAVLPVPAMAPAGRAISAAMSDRWAFEAIGRDLGLRSLFANDESPLGPALLDEFGSTWTISHLGAWLTLLGFAATFLVAAWAMLTHRCRAQPRT